MADEEITAAIAEKSYEELCAWDLEEAEKGIKGNERPRYHIRRRIREIDDERRQAEEDLEAQAREERLTPQSDDSLFIEKIQKLSVDQLRKKDLQLQAEGGEHALVGGIRRKAIRDVLQKRGVPVTIEEDLAEDRPVPRNEFFARVLYGLATRHGAPIFAQSELPDLMTTVSNARRAYLVLLGFNDLAEKERKRGSILNAKLAEENEFQPKGGYGPPGPGDLREKKLTQQVRNQAREQRPVRPEDTRVHAPHNAPRSSTISEAFEGAIGGG